MRIVAFFEMAVALALVAAHDAIFHGIGLSSWLIDYHGGAAERLSRGEEVFFAMQLVIGLPACVLFADAMARLLVDRPLLTLALARPRAFVGMAAATAAIFAAVIAWQIFRFVEFTDDERTYLFEARSLLDGGITSIAPTPRSAFRHQFVVFVGTDRWAGIFPPGQPALLALGLLVGHAHLTQYVCAAGVVWVTARFAEEEWGAEASVVTAALLALSPALVLTAATLHNVLPTALCAALVVRHTAKLVRGEARAHAIVVGAAAGFAHLCRPLDGVLLALWAAGFLLATNRSRAFSTLGVAAVAGAPFLALQLLTYRAISGSPFVTPYRVWLSKEWPNAKLFGFGTTVWGYDHSFPTALRKTLAAIVRISSWAFGWPASIAAIFAFGAGIGRDRATRALVVLAAMNLVAYFFYAFAAVQDFGTYYHLLSVPALAALTARVLLALRDRMRAKESRRASWPLHLAGAATLFGLVTFVPCELARLKTLAKSIRGPMELGRKASQVGPAIIFYERASPPHVSWVYWSRLPSTKPEQDPALWVRTTDANVKAVVAEHYRDRRPWQLHWIEGKPFLERLELVKKP